MEILKPHIKTLKSGFFSSLANEGVKHVKILPYLSVVQATEGSYDIALGNGETVQTGEGGFFIAPAYEKQTIVHHINPESGNMSGRWLFIDVEINNSYKLDKLYNFPIVINDEKKEKLSRLLDIYFSSDNIWERYGVCYKVLEILMERATPVSFFDHYGISTAFAYMTEHYKEQMTIEELSEIARMSKSNFYAAFKKRFGISPISYINHYRLSVAAEKIVGSRLSVKEIAFSVGFSDPLYFSKLFKKEYGVAPVEYRSMHAEG